MSQCNTENVVIIGAGIAGVSAALRLSTRHKIILIEKNKLFSGASGRNPGRLGLGFHYYDLETAKMYLHASIQVQKAYPSFLIGQDLPFEHPIRHGRYFVTKKSSHSFQDVLKIYRALQQEYRNLVEHDPCNMVFGHPDNFITVLSREDDLYSINHHLVEGAFKLVNIYLIGLNLSRIFMSNLQKYQYHLSRKY